MPPPAPARERDDQQVREGRGVRTVGTKIGERYPKNELWKDPIYKLQKQMQRPQEATQGNC
jgi:hypothetical protein